MTHEQDALSRAADLLIEKLQEDRVIHVFGTGGHSIIGAMEMFQRAGCIQSMAFSPLEFL